MTEPQPPIQLQLTKEQQALIHSITGEHAQVLELRPSPTDGTSGEGSVVNFGWRLSVDSGIPRQQWILGRGVPPAAAMRRRPDGSGITST